jgi:hypothetical protein
MELLILGMPILAAIVLAAMEYSLIYLLLGGGLIGAIVIFFVARMFGQ